MAAREAARRRPLGHGRHHRRPRLFGSFRRHRHGPPSTFVPNRTGDADGRVTVRRYVDREAALNHLVVGVLLPAHGPDPERDRGSAGVVHVRAPLGRALRVGAVDVRVNAAGLDVNAAAQHHLSGRANDALRLQALGALVNLKDGSAIRREAGRRSAGTFRCGAAVLDDMEAKRTLAIIAGIAAALTVMGCGAGSNRPATTPAATALVLRAHNNVAGTAVLTLRCDPPGGTLPDAAAACARLSHAPPGVLLHPRAFRCPGRPAVTVGSAHQGAHERPAHSRRHRHLPDATGTVDPSAWDHHQPASSSHRRGSLTHFPARRHAPGLLAPCIVGNRPGSRVRNPGSLPRWASG